MYLIEEVESAASSWKREKLLQEVWAVKAQELQYSEQMKKLKTLSSQKDTKRFLVDLESQFLMFV